ncbi:hypothetical protein DD237_005970 [Peronospora effusa]|uniref:RxLR effector candidate protein n=1 Tax=Peronospora effusa TaxID=542832 RepID=A0A3R8CSY9_9STRA|nr:hypothetical protein DD237_005970 [Peronospora effusa]
MLSVKYLVVFLALCVTHTCVVSGEGYNFQKYMGSNQNQTQGDLVLTPTLSETLHPEISSSVETIEVYMPIPIKTPRPEILAVEDTEVYVPTLTEKPCPPLPTPTFETESDTEDLIKETALYDGVNGPEFPSPVVSLMMETHSPFETAPYTPTPAPTQAPGMVPLASEPTETASASELAAPCPTLVMASETEASQTEKTTETYSTPTIPCPTFTLMPEPATN